MEKHGGVDPAQEQQLCISSQEVITYPVLSVEPSSLSATEKMLIGQFIQLIMPRTILELGVYHALTTRYLCDFLRVNDLSSMVFGFDIPEIIMDLRSHNSFVQELEQMRVLQLVSGHLPMSLSTWLKSHTLPVDMAIIDASHSFQNVTRELDLIWPRLSPEGIIFCHDYHWENISSIPGDMKGVAYAVDFFAASRRNVHVLSLKSSAAACKCYGWERQSVLVALRRRPYQPRLQRLIPHLLDAAIWKLQGYKYGIVKGKK